MATYSTGISVAWAGVTFQEVTGISWTRGGAREDRGSGASSGWTSSPGSVTLTTLNATGVSSANSGIYGTLTITGGGMDYTGGAIYESISADAELNGVTRYTVNFTLLS